MKNPILIYDFDGTLTPYAWTKFEILEKCGFEGGAYSPEFVDLVHTTAKKDGLDSYSALWKEYFRALKTAGFSLTDENFIMGAKNLEYNPGVEDFLNRVSKNHAKNIILSSGLKIFLDHTKIAPLFDEIHATTFSYNDDNRAIGIDFLMNEKNKAKVLKRILDQNLQNPENLENVVYFGDGLTDFYAMEYIKNRGGKTIFVSPPEKIDQNPDEKIAKKPDRKPNKKPNKKPSKNASSKNPLSSFPDPSIITFETVADYSLGSPLDRYIAELFS